jgi:hypothetical protein
LPGVGASDSQGLFPPGATVVLVAGVPGDVESEENYREQLQGWLDIVADGGQAARVFVLCDEPKAVRLPGRLESSAKRR